LPRTNFENNFKNKVVKWEGTVLRVDSFDEDVELLAGATPGKVPDSQSERDNFKALNIHSTDSQPTAEHQGHLYQSQIHLRMEPRFKQYSHALSDDKPDFVLWLDQPTFE